MKSSCHFFFSHSVLLCPNLYSAKIHNSLTAPSCISLVPIRFSTAHRLLISLHCSTLKVFTSHVKSSQANFFNCEIRGSYRRLLEPSTAFNSDCLMLLLVMLGIRFSSKHSAHTPQKTCLRYCCVTRGITWSLHTFVWLHPGMRCVATEHARTRRKRFHTTVAGRMR
jgi:hypothetical protein